MSDWRVRGVDQLASVNAYYQGVASVRETTLRPPTAPFFRIQELPTANEVNASATAANRARKKRKRQQLQQRHLDELQASGKFVPLCEEIVDALERAHKQALSAGEWEVATVDDSSRPRREQEDIGDHHECAVEIADDSYANTNDVVVRITHDDQVCLMPPHSQFLKGDVRIALHAKTTALDKFQFVLMDPPWENKSVDRKRCYKTFHHRELLKLPMQSLCSGGDYIDGCVLAIWVTNRPTFTSFILNELLAHWGFTYHATWYWLKVCTTGELVTPLRASHRLPVEKLIVATRASCSGVRERLRAQLGHVPRVVVSVPLRHSWKPPPESFFDGETLAGRNLELFARELRPHFVSVGNEPLKFQTAAHFNLAGGYSPFK